MAIKQTGYARVACPICGRTLRIPVTVHVVTVPKRAQRQMVAGVDERYVDQHRCKGT